MFIEALRKIRPGEELTYDYRLSYDGSVTRKVREAFACRCGTEACRGSMLLDKKKRKKRKK